MKLSNDYRNLEWGWSGGLTEPYCAFLHYQGIIPLASKKHADMEFVCNKILLKKVESILIVESIKKMNVPARVFVCDYINDINTIVEEYKKIREKFVFDGETKKYINSLKNVFPTLTKYLEENYNNFDISSLATYFESNILQNTLVINEIVKNDKIKEKDIKSEVSKLNQFIEKDINNIPSLVPDNEIIEFFSQFVGIEIIGSDGKINDGNIIEGAINILNR